MGQVVKENLSENHSERNKDTLYILVIDLSLMLFEYSYI